MKSICLSMAYLAPVEYFVALTNADIIYIEHCDYYQKQTYRNRCYIAGSNGLLPLSIPVDKISSTKILSRDIQISEHSDWQLNHWRSIESAYNSTPFFEYYKDDLILFYEKKWRFLWDFNFEIQTKIFELLELKPTIKLTEEYLKNTNDNIVDLRESIHPKIQHTLYKAKPYYQVFEQRFGFQENLSIVDLLFNMGNESQLIIHNL